MADQANLSFFHFTETATKKDKIDDKIHFTVNCRSMDDFLQFVDNNDTSGIELTTKLF